MVHLGLEEFWKSARKNLKLQLINYGERVEGHLDDVKGIFDWIWETIS